MTQEETKRLKSRWINVDKRTTRLAYSRCFGTKTMPLKSRSDKGMILDFVFSDQSDKREMFIQMMNHMAKSLPRLKFDYEEALQHLLDSFETSYLKEKKNDNGS
jgi:hypothetical protein